MLAYTHTQSTPSTTWLVSHNLGHKPVVDVWVDYNGTQEKILPYSIIHINDNIMQVVFTTAYTGAARLL
jgi:3-oxoacyl-ACP reductase-like protein